MDQANEFPSMTWHETERFGVTRLADLMMSRPVDMYARSHAKVAGIDPKPPPKPPKPPRIKGRPGRRRTLSDDLVRQIVARLAAGEFQQRIADAFRISVNLVNQINNGRAYGDVTGIVEGQKASGRTQERTYLTHDRVHAILDLRDAGLTQREVARRLGVLQQTIGRIENAEYYRAATLGRVHDGNGTIIRTVVSPITGSRRGRRPKSAGNARTGAGPA